MKAMKAMILLEKLIKKFLLLCFVFVFFYNCSEWVSNWRQYKYDDDKISDCPGAADGSNKTKIARQKCLNSSTLSSFSIHSIRTNSCRVESFHFVHSLDFLALSETHLISSISSTEFSVPGYLSLCRDDNSPPSDLFILAELWMWI